MVEVKSEHSGTYESAEEGVLGNKLFPSGNNMFCENQKGVNEFQDLVIEEYDGTFDKEIARYKELMCPSSSGDMNEEDILSFNGSKDTMLGCTCRTDCIVLFA